MTYEIVIPVIIAFAISALLGPVVIPFLRKLKVGQTERKELESHLKKNGTPTMGGIMILASIIITSLFYVKDYPKIIPMYAEPDTLELGVTEIQLSDVTVRIFEKERLICECLKYEDKMDRERFKEGLMAYIKDPKKDIAKLMYYAKERKVVKKVQNMIGVWL